MVNETLKKSLTQKSMGKNLYWLSALPAQWTWLYVRFLKMLNKNWVLI